MLVAGVIAPVVASIDNPDGEEVKTPPEYAPVPVNSTSCAVTEEVQKGLPGYEIVAVGRGLTVTGADAVLEHPVIVSVKE